MTSAPRTTLPARLAGRAVTETYTRAAPVYDTWGRLTETKARRRCLEWADPARNRAGREEAVAAIG